MRLAIFRQKSFIIPMLIILLLTGGIVVWRINQPSAPPIPKKITEQILYPIYMPTSLPDGFHIDPGTYTIKEGALLFQAKSESGDAIAFSEQAKPGNIDFSTFYTKNFVKPRNVSGAPYPSVVGTAEGGIKIVSITTDNTWIIATSYANLPADALQNIAKSMKPQK